MKKLVEAGGGEPETDVEEGRTARGQELATSGQVKAQVVDRHGNTGVLSVESETSGGQRRTAGGHTENIAGAQQEHNGIALKIDLPELEKVVVAWPLLPDAIKQGILAMINVAVEKRAGQQEK